MSPESDKGTESSACPSAVSRAEGLLSLASGLNGSTCLEEVADVVFKDALSVVGADGGVLALVQASRGARGNVSTSFALAVLFLGTEVGRLKMMSASTR